MGNWETGNRKYGNGNVHVLKFVRRSIERVTIVHIDIHIHNSRLQ